MSQMSRVKYKESDVRNQIEESGARSEIKRVINKESDVRS